MRLDLTGKTAVVTGAGAGIGLAVARALTGAGARVFGGARTVSPELKECTPHTLEVDLATEDGPGLLVAQALAQFGGIDVLVNNVGGGVKYAAGFLDIDDDVWRRAFELNVMTVVRASRAALPSLVERDGAIINIGSMSGRMASPELAHYAAAKAAVSNITEALSTEFCPRGVRVNTISPGPTRTRLWTDLALARQFGMSPEEFAAAAPAMAGLATGELIEPNEIAAMVVLLASGRVRSVTGADHPVAAGMVPPRRGPEG